MREAAPPPLFSPLPVRLPAAARGSRHSGAGSESGSGAACRHVPPAPWSWRSWASVRSAACSAASPPAPGPPSWTCPMSSPWGWWGCSTGKGRGGGGSRGRDGDGPSEKRRLAGGPGRGGGRGRKERAAKRKERPAACRLPPARPGRRSSSGTRCGPRLHLACVASAPAAGRHHRDRVKLLVYLTCLWRCKTDLGSLRGCRAAK